MQSSDLHTPGPLRATALALALGLALLPLAACPAATPSAPTVTVHSSAGDAVVRVELALTREQQMRGLMFRTEMAEDAGMLFVFEDEAERAFWMSNTPLPLDILYVKGDGTVRSIAERTVPYSEKLIPSRGPARYVLEVNAGWAGRHGVRPGDRLSLPDLPAAPGAAPPSSGH